MMECPGSSSGSNEDLLFGIAINILFPEVTFMEISLQNEIHFMYNFVHLQVSIHSLMEADGLSYEQGSNVYYAF